MEKKIISLILAVSMLLCALNIAAAAQPKIIDEIKIDYADLSPVIGETANDNLGYSIVPDEPYDVSVNTWYNATDAVNMEADDVFEENKEYQRMFVLMPILEYTFTENTLVTINGETVDTEKTGYDPESGSFTVYSAVIEAAEYIVVDVVDIYADDLTPYATDKASEHCDYQVIEDFENYLVTDQYWYNATDASQMKPDDVFEEGKLYSKRYIVEPIEGYVFTEETHINIDETQDDVDTEVSCLLDSTHILVASVAREAVYLAVIPDITITDLDVTPIIGETAGQHTTYTISEDVNFTITASGWMDYTNIKNLNDNDVFAADTEYSFYFDISANDGYRFTQDTVVTLNGSTELIGEVTLHAVNWYIISTNPMQAQQGEVTPTPTPTTEPIYYIGDVNSDGVVNTGDAVLVLKYAAEMITLDATQMLSGDVNYDRIVNTGDAVAILKFAAGMITEF